jgi:exopolysaccharide production protein ExoZ
VGLCRVGCALECRGFTKMRTIVSVQALRAIAALAVVLCHFDQLNAWLAGRKDPYPLDQLSSGVDLFFVISGFVMVYSSGDLFGAKGGWLTFFTRRVARIVPPYWIAMAIAVPVMSLPSDWGSLLGSYLFFPYLSASGNFGPVYGVGWTLNFEMYFYALFSAAVFLRRDIAVSVLCGTLCVIVLLGYLLQPSFAPLKFWSDPIIMEFAFGMALALLYIRGTQIPTAIRIGLVVAGVAAIIFFNNRSPPSGFRVVQWGIPAAMIFAGTVLGRDINFGWFRGPVKALGNASYALYLAHPLMIAAVLLGWPLGINRYPKMMVLFLAIVCAQAASVAVYYLFERRFSKFINRHHHKAMPPFGVIPTPEPGTFADPVNTWAP